VEGKKLANSEIKEICKELNPLTHSFRNDVVDVAVYAKFLANRAKENILNGNLNRSKINSNAQEEDGLSQDDRIGRVIMHTTGKKDFVRHMTSQNQAQAADGVDNSVLLKMVRELQEGLNEQRDEYDRKMKEQQKEIDDLRQQIGRSG
jgi:vacuolar-type H+-ATPase subunit I/STV1